MSPTVRLHDQKLISTVPEVQVPQEDIIYKDNVHQYKPDPSNAKCEIQTASTPGQEVLGTSMLPDQIVKLYILSPSIQHPTTLRPIDRLVVARSHWKTSHLSAAYWYSTLISCVRHAPSPQRSRFDMVDAGCPSRREI